MYKTELLKKTGRCWPAFVGAALALGGFLILTDQAGLADSPDPFASISQQVTQPDAAVSPNLLSARAAVALLRAEKDPFWLSAEKIEFHTAPELPAQPQEGVTHSAVRRTLLEGDTSKMDIALTFDDGPHAQTTPELLSILEQNNVKATFFLVGEKVEEDPQLAQEEIADGDSVGNHTYNHVSLVKIPRDYVATEIKACGEVLHSVTGEKAHLFRPPGGAFDPVVQQTSEKLGYTTVLWTDDPGDYKSPGAQVILDRVLRKATPGGIILLHDGINQTMQILPALIETLRERGYHFVTIDQMLTDKAAHLSAAPVDLIVKR